MSTFKNGRKIACCDENSHIDNVDINVQDYSFVKIIGKRSLAYKATGEGAEFCSLLPPLKAA